MSALARPSRAVRTALATIIGIASGAAVFSRGLRILQQGSDFDPVWKGARAVLSGQNPYTLLAPVVHRSNDWGLYYPMPAVLVAMPLAPFPLAMARGLFFGGSAALLAYAITREGYFRLPVFASMAFLQAAWLVQWSPLLTAAALIPALGGLLVVKPNVGLGIGASVVPRSAVLPALLGAAGLVALSFVLLPTWVGDWLDALRDTSHIRAPITRPGGALVLLALLRWRRPEARLVSALACIPQTPGPYECIVLFLVATTLRESILLAYLTYVTFFAVGLVQTDPSIQGWMEACGDLMVPFIYLPCTWMVLRRPNVGDVPWWLDVLATAGARPTRPRRWGRLRQGTNRSSEQE